MVLPNKQSHYIADKKYKIFLGNGVKMHFDNAKDANTFLHQTNTFLTQCLYDLNDIYSSVFTFYRRYWFYINDSRDFQTLLEILEKRFNLVIERNHSPNASYMIFNHLFEIIQRLSEFLDATTKVVEMQRISVDWHLIDIIQLRLKRINDLIEAWGKSDFQIQEFGEEWSKKLRKQACFHFIKPGNIGKTD